MGELVDITDLLAERHGLRQLGEKLLTAFTLQGIKDFVETTIARAERMTPEERRAELVTMFGEEGARELLEAEGLLTAREKAEARWGIKADWRGAERIRMERIGRVGPDRKRANRKATERTGRRRD